MTGPSDKPSPGEGEPKLIMPAERPSMFSRLRTYFFTGIIITAPISLTVYLAWQLISWVDDQVTPLLPAKYHPETYLPFSVPGLGLLIMLVFLTSVGFFTANIFGRTLIRLGERLVNRMPVVRTVYNALKQILETVLQNSSQSFRQVVMVEYPRKGVWAVAFVTADTQGEIETLLDDDFVNIFVPTTPNPTSGFLLIVPRKDLIFLEMSVEEAAKFIISAGVIMPVDPTQAAPQAVPSNGKDKSRKQPETAAAD